MAGIDRETLREHVAEYEEREAFRIVEDDRLETMPTAFAEGSYLWKDVEWIVRWYCRRPLDGRVHPAEEAFRTNSMDAIEAAIDAARAGDTPAERVEALLALAGVDTPIASAFLQFMDPDRFVVVDGPSWTTLHGAGELAHPYPSTVLPSDYEAYLDACRRLASESELRVVDIGRALWRLGSDR